MATRGLGGFAYFDAYFDLPPWDEGTWRELEALLDLQSPHRAVRAEIEHQVCLYLAEALLRAGGAPKYVRTPTMATRLRAIATAAKRLRTLLTFAGQDGREQYEGRYARGRLSERIPLVSLDALPEVLDVLAWGALAAIRDLPPERTGPGRRRDEAFEHLVCRLADLFEQQTERPATAWRDGRDETYGGDFLTFMRTVFEHLPCIEMQEGALGEMVQRVLRKRRSRQNSQARGAF